MTKEQIRRFNRLCKGLNDLLKEVREKHPEANLYMEGEGGLYLLSGPSHDDLERSRQDRVLANCLIHHASGGAW